VRRLDGLGRALEMSSKVADFRNGSKTELSPLALHVRSTLKSRQRQAAQACPFRANNGLMHRSRQHRHSITSSARSGSDIGTSMRPCRLEA
jgi:hypothetical protein